MSSEMLFSESKTSKLTKFYFDEIFWSTTVPEGLLNNFGTYVVYLAEIELLVFYGFFVLKCTLLDFCNV